MVSLRKAWIFGSVAVGALILVAAWLLLLMPVREAAAESNEEAQMVEDSNMVLSAKVNTLRKQFEEIETYRTELATLQKKIPTDVDYTSLTNELVRASEEAEIALLSISVDGSIESVEPFTELKEVKPAASAVEGEEAKATPTPSPSPTEIETKSGEPPTATGALSKVIDGFYQIPLTLTMQGDYDAVLKFSKSLQEGSERAILIHAVQLTALREAEESASAPKTEIGDMTFELNGFAYVLQDQFELRNGPAKTDSEDEVELKLPKPAKDNLFAPER